MLKKTLKELRRQAKNAGYTTEKPDQDATPENESDWGKKKPTPNSTISQIWKMVKGKRSGENDGKNDNWEQAANWDEAISEINLSDIEEYSLRLVDTAQLKALGIPIPVEEDTVSDLYAVFISSRRTSYT